jgi:hypothetical protein
LIDCIVVFQCITLAVLGYRVATFNDCDEAAEELKQVSTELGRLWVQIRLDFLSVLEQDT